MDGFCCAWILRYALATERVEFVAASYGDAPPPVKNQHVIIADFSYPLNTLESMRTQAESIVVYDHHESADFIQSLSYGNYAYDECGASMLAVAYGLPPIEGARELVEYVRDYDLWKFKLPGSREVNALIQTTPFDMAEWDALAGMPLPSKQAVGAMVLRAYKHMVRQAVAKATRVTCFGYDQIPVVNSLHLRNEIGEWLALDAPFAIVWHESGDGTRSYSFRSHKGEDSVDVSKIAQLIKGGGGHRNAAVASLPPGYHHPWAVPTR